MIIEVGLLLFEFGLEDGNLFPVNVGNLLGLELRTQLTDFSLILRKFSHKLEHTVLCGELVLCELSVVCVLIFQLLCEVFLLKLELFPQVSDFHRSRLLFFVQFLECCLQSGNFLVFRFYRRQQAVLRCLGILFILVLSCLLGPILEHGFFVVFLLQFQLLLERFDLVGGVLQLPQGFDEEAAHLVNCEITYLLRHLAIHLSVFEKTLQPLFVILHYFHVV